MADAVADKAFLAEAEKAGLERPDAYPGLLRLLAEDGISVEVAPHPAARGAMRYYDRETRRLSGMQAAMERHGWSSLDAFRSIRRDRVVAHSKIRRPDADVDQRDALAVRRNNTNGDYLQFMYDHPDYPSRLELQTTTPIG